MKNKPKNYLKVLKVTDEVTEQQGDKTVKHKNLLLEDEQNGLIDERMVYNNFLKYKDMKEGIKIRGNIIHMEGMTIVKFVTETLITAIENQKYKFKNDVMFTKLLKEAKKTEGLN